MSENKKCVLYVNGMHCASCESTIEKNLATHPEVKSVKANLNLHKVIVELNDEAVVPLAELNSLLSKTHYQLSEEKFNNAKINYKELIFAFLITCAVISIFIALQKLGIINLLRTDEITYPFVFLLGIVASLSSCIAEVGSFVLTLSSSYAKFGQDSFMPLVKFHISRIVSFFILGGLIGLLGSAFTLSPFVTLILGVILFFVMVVLGIGLLDVFPDMHRFHIHFPKFLSSKISNAENASSNIAPILFGVSTFFIPCGFTQSMQFYALTSGSIVKGALTMFAFALGTFPVLALISIASVKFGHSLQSKLFFRTAGFIVLFFAIVNLLGVLAVFGLIKPVFNF